MAKITMRNIQKSPVEQYFGLFLSSAAARGVKDKTLQTYKQHFHSVSKRMDVTVPMDCLNVLDLNNMILKKPEANLARKQIVLRHTKNGKVQVIPLSCSMVAILRDCMVVRGGSRSNYLFCIEFGDLLTENALQLAIARYNTTRGVERTSITQSQENKRKAKLIYHF